MRHAGGGTVDYDYDVFISYSHRGHVRDWVKNHFSRELQLYLEDLLPNDPRIFVDFEIPAGSAWPERLEQALLRSRCLVAIWSPPYFRSEWCMAEWKSMQRRQESLSAANGQAPTLVYPINFMDGDHFPEEAQKIQQYKELTKYGYDGPQFRDTPAYLGFQDRMRTVAEEVAACLACAPAWQEGWPIVRPAAHAESSQNSVPRL
ncbi:toll/interleukin-1 receptor domain-containing protein [Streptomyces sp. NBC_00028]|uniref:TIR domain-containing protein n=1 Tax=Streptomyces sp. NBC_00028 TaxID=2975624 RepID=UPI00324379C3